MKMLKNLIMGGLFFALLACGGGSSGSDSPTIRVLSPEQDSVYIAGDTIDFQIEVDNFKLRDPNTVISVMHSAQLRHSAPGSDLEHDHPVNDMDMDMEQSHDNANGYPSEGHYHLYLNDAKDSDTHLTLWNSIASYQIPDDIEPGDHSLRFELRDNHHQPLGIETYLFFTVSDKTEL